MEYDNHLYLYRYVSLHNHVLTRHKLTLLTLACIRHSTCNIVGQHSFLLVNIHFSWSTFISLGQQLSQRITVASLLAVGLLSNSKSNIIQFSCVAYISHSFSSSSLPSHILSTTSQFFGLRLF